MALVMTLFALALIMILLVALFAGVSHQIRGAQSDAAQAREKMLADSAVALVIGQIQQASTQTNQAWISQPGLLRTYSTNAVRTPTACYKLYSTASPTNMIDTSGNLNFFATDIPTNWASTPSQYTDLNSPAQTPGLLGRPIYPILDPAALTNTANQTAGTQVAGVSSDSGGVAMPVAWLYQLQDGTLGPASNGTAANPIVARMAFWADDDTCKININTAGCGSPWNTPRVNSTVDAAWSTNQPAAGEYSAYPGHPATTSLAMVFGTNSYSPQQLLALTPRYAWGGSEFGTQSTTAGENVPAKMDRLYASLDEFCFSTNFAGAGQRLTNSVSAAQLETARFVLTAHSEAPETTLLGEPRVAIWPVADSTSAGAPRITAVDSMITNAATVGVGTTKVRSYFFQRNNPFNTRDDFDPASTNSAPTVSNLQLFNDLVARGAANLPGYGATFSAKFPGAAWTQLLLEITDFIRGLNAVDPSPAPFVPFAAGDSTGVGRGFVVPLTTTYGSGPTKLTLRGLGRCPTLSSLTLVFYVCGFSFDAASKMNPIDFDTMPDDSTGTYWKANLTPSSPLWQHVTSEQVRAFVVPCTFQPGCGYPEVSDNCTIQISGLNGVNLTTATSNDFGFTTPLTSRPLSDALKVLPAERAWGGNEGPLAWRAAALDAQKSGAFTYVFAGTKAFSITLPTKPSYNATTKVLSWPHLASLLFHGAAGQTAIPLTILIRDASANTLQTLAASLPITVGVSATALAVPAPIPVAEYSQDGSGNAVMPSYYMTLKNRVLTTQTNREFLIQPGDVSRSIEAGTDLRLIAALPSVPATMFKAHPSYSTSAVSHAHNLHFADGTAVYGGSGIASLVSSATYAAATSSLTWTDWCKNGSTNYAWPISPRGDCPTTSVTGSVTMQPVQNIDGDWDTGPGLSPDGAQINLPDSGTSLSPASAYFSLTGGQVGAATQRTPSALVPSPVIFGSLPAGINPATPAQSEPWRTLLFCPYPAAGANHPGFAFPPDHLILDNFWMPVVKPYGISTCMATAGKINLNDQIAPFTYLHRNTALRALLDDLRIPAIPVTAAGTYKSPGAPSNSVFWNAVDEDATVAQIEDRFAGASADAYLSESEICTVHLVPSVSPSLVSSGVSATRAAVDSFWIGDAAPGWLTGDNLRELPYAQLYSRLTTRSNSYTVHVRVQVLQKLSQDPHQDVWNEGVDLVQGDWRGSYEIERYLDPAATAPAAGSQLGPYKFRILSSRRFAP
jgi:uncharacterized protein (TIGR02600 family)